MGKFRVYILYSNTLCKYYIGFTGDSVTNRLSKHLSNHKGFTSKAKDWKIVFTKEFNSKVEAMKEERKLKSWKNKLRIEAYILRTVFLYIFTEVIFYNIL